MITQGGKILGGMKYAALLLLSACGRIAFDPLLESKPIDAANGDVILGGEPMPRACLMNVAYTTKAGSPNRYREGIPSVTWAAAQADCVADGARLWIIESALEQSSWTGDWTGVTDAATEGTWLTVDGTPATFLPWLAGQPDGGAAEDCVRADSAGFEDRDCNDMRDFVCECPVN